MHGGGIFNGPLTPAQIDDRIEARQSIWQSSSMPPRPTGQDCQHRQGCRRRSADAAREAQVARTQAVTLLTAPPSIVLPSSSAREQIGLAETASKRIAQALTDAAEVLNRNSAGKLRIGLRPAVRGRAGIAVERTAG
jgi:hypothetical protein